MWFDGWPDVRRVLLVGPVAYLAMVAMLRVSGKRTLSKMNAFDLVVTVALGSTLATILLSENVALLEGVAAIVVLIVAQYVISFLSVRFETFQNFVKAQPALVYHHGFLRAAMRSERITEEEVRAAVREAGAASLEGIVSVVIETDGTFSVIRDDGGGAPTALANVSGPDGDPPRSDGPLSG